MDGEVRCCMFSGWKANNGCEYSNDFNEWVRTLSAESASLEYLLVDRILEFGGFGILGYVQRSRKVSHRANFRTVISRPLIGQTYTILFTLLLGDLYIACYSGLVYSHMNSRVHTIQ
jgi:hypothetical protein